MNIQAMPVSILETDADTVLIYLFSGDETLAGAAAALNSALDGLVADLFDGGDFSAKAEQVAVVYPRGAIKARRVLLVGLGERESFQLNGLRRASAVASRRARDLNAERLAISLPAAELVSADLAQAVVEGALMGLYAYHGQKTDDKPQVGPQSIEVIIDDETGLAELLSAAQRGKAYADGAWLARDLVNMPPNICTPEYLAQRASEMAEAVGLKCEALGVQQMRALKMGALLAVAQGSDAPPRFIVMEHNADRAKELDTVVLVGKGVTFDTGGYSLKTPDGMVGMKADMGGGAAVIAAMQVIATLDIPLHVVGLVPAADNMISGHAYRPQEVVTASNGKTIEIISTDAEGRLLLADALVYAQRYQPSAVVDIATLTGACLVALGKVAAGLFASDDALRDSLVAAAEATGELVWPMPLFPEYKKDIESQTADMKNSGGRAGGAATAAAFLSNFVDYPAWGHIDMAGMMLDAEGNPCIPEKGGTGYGARLLAQFVERWASSGMKAQ